MRAAAEAAEFFATHVGVLPPRKRLTMGDQLALDLAEAKRRRKAARRAREMRAEAPAAA